jgi:transposase-like protein
MRSNSRQSRLIGRPRKPRVVRKRSAAEWAKLLALFERSGLSQKRFCRENEVALSTLQYWRRESGRGRREGALVEVPVMEPPYLRIHSSTRHSLRSARSGRSDLDASWIIGNAKPMAVVHNPGASRPVPLGLLPAQDEYTATPKGPDEYALERRPGRLAQV